MAHIPSLTQDQLELLRLAKKDEVEELRLSYEFPVIDHRNPPIGHPSFVQGLIDARLIQVKVQGTSLSASEFQQESWAEFSKDLDSPTQVDWDQWRQGLIAQQDVELDYLMTPGNVLEEFSTVWIREISLKAIQPSNPE